MSHNEDSGRPQHQQKHRNRDSKPYDRRSDDSSTNRRGGSHDNRRSGNHDNRLGGYNDNRRGGYNDNRRGGRGNRRGGYQDNTPVPPEVEAKVKLLFDKSYVFDGGYSLPDSSTWFSNDPFEVEELQSYKESLNQTKDKLNDKDKEVWHRHTRFTNPAGNIMRTVRNELSAELLTQAWAKFYEMAGKVVPENPAFTSVHICEAPGGFICALNHYLKRNNPECQWRWFGMTLNPYFEGNTAKEMVDDDLFISKTYNNWYFGGDNSGNIMNRNNILDLKEKISCDTDVMLVTADGSIDCSDKPNEQEATVAHLHYCESISAITLLAPGGNFVLKGFTLFEHSTLCLTYLLCCVFNKVEIVKPLTSKSGNSETYTLCTGFKGVSEEQLSELQRHHSLQSSDKALFSRSDIPDDFLVKFTKCSQKFMSYQQNMIESNIRTFESLEQPEKHELFQTKNFAVQYYLKNACKGLGQIPAEERLVRDIYLDGTKLNTTAMLSSDGKKGSNRRQNAQSHSEAQQKQSLIWFDRVVLPELTLVTSDAAAPSVAEKLMAQMGYNAGQGLGREGVGRTEIIQVKQLEVGAGLGYAVNPVNTAVVKTADDVQWFQHPDVSSNTVTLEPSTTAGRCLTNVTNSRFLSVDTLERLNDAELNNSVTKLPDLCERAKSVLPFYALSSLGDSNMVEYQMSYVNKLTGILSAPECKGADLSASGMFSSYLTKHCTKTESLVDLDDKQPDHPKCLDLIAFDSSSKSDMLNGLRLLVKYLKIGGNCVFHCHKLQDRFTVSVVYLITSMFKATSLIKTKTCCPHSPDFYIVAKHHHTSFFSDLESYISQCLGSLRQATKGGKDLLEILPISYLFQPHFYKFISCFNEKVSQDAVDNIIDLEKMNHQKSFPSGKSNRFIMDCMMETQ